MDTIQKSIVYAVNSDLDDGILYAEFETRDSAIEYAKRNLDKLPFVDELQVSRDANGEIDLKVEDLRLGESRGNNNNQQRKQNFQQRKQNNQKKKH